MKNRLFIIGASILQVPAIRKAKEMGLTVAVADYNPNAAGVPLADRYYNVSTIDEEGVYKAAKDFGADGIMTLATDMPMRALAYACGKLGLPAISRDTAVRATDKGEMIRAFEAAGAEHPWFFIAKDREAFKEILPSVTYPCVMKPTDSSGSRGVVLAHDREELVREYGYTLSSSRGGAVILEEYMRGPEFSVEVMVTGGEPHVLQVTDKLTTGAPHFVEMGHSQPSGQSPENLEKIRDLARRAVKAVGIGRGPAHVEIILTEDGPKMVELGARMGGDCITTHLVPLSTGIDMIHATIDMALGKEPDIAPKWNKGAAIRYFRTEPGVLRSIEGTDEARAIDGVKEISFVKKPGEQVGEIGSSGDRIGFVIAQADTAEKAVAVCEEAMRTVVIRM